MRALSVLLAISVSGCSFVVAERLPRHYRSDRTPECGLRRLPVIADIALATLMALQTGVVAYAISQEGPETTDEKRRTHRLVVLEFGGATAVATGSALYGLWQRDRCAAAREAHDEWLRHHALPQKNTQPARAPADTPGNPSTSTRHQPFEVEP